jgi:hypothetical protein
MLGSDVLSSSQCLIAELIGLLNRDSILTFELIAPFGAVGRVAASGPVSAYAGGGRDTVAMRLIAAITDLIA